MQEDRPAPDRLIAAARFAGDTGAADPALAEALQAHAGDPARLPEVLAALHGARVLAPVVAVAEHPGPADEEKSADIALPVLLDGEGGRAVVVFSSLATLGRWDPAARPVPVEATRAAAVAVAEEATALVVDVAGPHPATLGAPEVRALLSGRGAVPAYADPALSGLLAQVLASVPEVRTAWLSPGAGVDARLTLAVRGGADHRAVAAAVADRLRALVEHTVRGLDLVLVADPGAAPGGTLVFPAPPRG